MYPFEGDEVSSDYTDPDKQTGFLEFRKGTPLPPRRRNELSVPNSADKIRREMIIARCTNAFLGLSVQRRRRQPNSPTANVLTLNVLRKRRLTLDLTASCVV